MDTFPLSFMKLTVAERHQKYQSKIQNVKSAERRFSYEHEFDIMLLLR
jgi:hypothetical protein